MLIRDWITNEIVTIFDELTVNSVAINVTQDTGKAKGNHLLVFLGDESNVFSINDASTESGTSIAFDLIFETGRKGNHSTIQNEAIEELKNRILTYRNTLGKRYENENYRVEIIDIVITNIYVPEDMNDKVVLLMLQGEIFINQYLLEA